MKKSDPKTEDLYLSRELSLLEFNRRVLKQAQDKRIPLLERLKFLFICSSNLDEFFEIRVAGIKQQIAFGKTPSGHTHWNGPELLKEISKNAHKIVEKQYEILNKELRPALRTHGMRFITEKQWSKAQAKWAKEYFRSDILPVISPIALDLAHPFPRLVNKSLNFIVTLEGEDAFGRRGDLAIVHAPRSIPRVIPVPEELHRQYILLVRLMPTVLVKPRSSTTRRPPDR